MCLPLCVSLDRHTADEEVTQHFAGDIDAARLKIQLQMLSSSPSIIDATIVNIDEVIQKLIAMATECTYSQKSAT